MNADTVKNLIEKAGPVLNLFSDLYKNSADDREIRAWLEFDQAMVSFEAEALSEIEKGSNVNIRLIAAAPDMLQALEDAAQIMVIAKKYFPKSIKNSDKFALLNIENNSVKKAIAKAKD